MGDGRRRRAAADARYRGFLRNDRRYGVRFDLHAGLLRHLPLARRPPPERGNERGATVEAGRMNQMTVAPIPRQVGSWAGSSLFGPLRSSTFRPLGSSAV